ncbi:hypothetical protein ABZ543_10100 [Streptomyces roseifaciens]
MSQATPGQEQTEQQQNGQPFDGEREHVYLSPRYQRTGSGEPPHFVAQLVDLSGGAVPGAEIHFLVRSTRQEIATAVTDASGEALTDQLGGGLLLMNAAIDGCRAVFHGSDRYCPQETDFRLPPVLL